MKPTVLFILHLPPPVHGASMMGEYIHDSKVINEAFDCHYINLSTAKDLADIGKVGIKKLFQFVDLLRLICRTVRSIRPRLVYVTPNACGRAFYKDFIVVEMLKRMGCKLVLHYHNKGVSTRQDRKLDNMLYKRFFSGVKVILLAENLYLDVQKYIARENVAICPNGIPDMGDAIIRRLVPADSSNPLNILFLSNMMEEKGVWVLLEACKSLKEHGLDFVCRFIGGWKDITEEAFYDKAVNLGLTVSTPLHKRSDAEVQALGPKYGAGKMECFRQADIFVFPTYYNKECFPLVLLEAMQAGLACVSTKEAGIPAIIDQGRTGLMVEQRNSQALADAIGRMITNRQLCVQMGQEGRRKYENFFTIGAFDTRMYRIMKRWI